jgi:NADH:ubiquinone oxidoreductase subunit 6 (subunit J)
MNFEWLFFVFLGIILLAGVAVVATKNVLYASLCLLVVLLGVASVYVWAGADFVAVAQILLYVGSILVLILFGIMLTKRQNKDENPVFFQKNMFFAAFIAFGLFYLFAKTILNTSWKITENAPSVAQNRINNVENIGFQLITTYALPFELTAVLLLVALVGAATIVGKKNV